MNILLTNQHLYRPGGSETAFYTLGIELLRQGHEVDIYSPNKGDISRRMIAAGCGWIKQGHYDRVIASHWPTQKHVMSNPRITYDKLIRVCHGAIPDLEQPLPGADAYVAISEEVQAHLKRKGYDSTVILNGIDCERFKPKGKPNKKTVLSLCQSNKANNLLKEACKLAGMKLEVLNKFVSPVWEVEKAINRAAVVVSLGRGALEAMACNRPVIVWDWRDYNGNKGDGPINIDGVGKIARFNFSGRYMKLCDVSPTALWVWIKAWTKADVSWSRDWVLKNANIEIQAKRYLEL